MNYLDVIKKCVLKPGKHEIVLERIFPLELDTKGAKVTYFIGSEEQKTGVIYANRLEVETDHEIELTVVCGKGYVAEPDEELTNKFLKYEKWSGGDGIYSFNMTSGKDGFDQEQNMKTLFVFGDTFVGTSDKKTNRRYQPHLMPNNSLGIMEHGKIDFHVNWRPDGSVSSFYKMDPKFDDSGTVVANLVYYDRKEKNIGWLSGYQPKEIMLTFDLSKTRSLTHIYFYNYFSEEGELLSKRGIKHVSIYGSKDGITYEKIKDAVLERATQMGHKQSVNVEGSFRFIRFDIPRQNGLGNYNDDTFSEGLFGLNLVKFFDGSHQYRDIYATSTSTLLRDPEHSWIWLQDGVIIKDHLYFLPMTINSDLNQPEGLQFCVKGVALYKTPIKNQMIDHEHATQKMAPLLVDSKDSQWLMGGAIMANTKSAGAKNPDGYIYIYGYKTTWGLRELVVARVLEENFEYFDDWRYYNGSGWVTNIFEAKPILEHISCEMSVSQLLEGHNKGKYIAIYTYDTNTPDIAFSIGDSPVGPFTPPQKIYHTPEQEEFKSTTYTYNAKAHPHLSKSTDILVSYNTNTYNFEHNMSNNLIYRARFIRMKDTTR